MGHDWIVSVLSDLRTYAEQNGLPSLAGQLADTALVARAEIANQTDGRTGKAHGERAQSGYVPREVGAR